MRATGDGWIVDCNPLQGGGWACDVSVATQLGTLQGSGRAVPRSSLPAGAAYVGDTSGQQLGAGIGTAAGTAAGAFLGPAGAALGGLLGGLLGGVIGDEASGSGGGPVVRPASLPGEGSLANLERIARFVGLTDGMDVVTARGRLQQGLTQNWAGPDHNDARRLLAELGTANSGTIPSVSQLAQLAASRVAQQSPAAGAGLGITSLVLPGLGLSTPTPTTSPAAQTIAALVPLILQNPALLQMVLANPALLQLLPLLMQYPGLLQIAAQNPQLLQIVLANPQLLGIILRLATGQTAPGIMIAGLMDDRRGPAFAAGWGAIAETEHQAPDVDTATVGLLSAGRRYLDAVAGDLVGAPGGSVRLARAESLAAARPEWARGKRLAIEAAQL